MSKPRGRPPHKPTPATKKKVKEWSGRGMPQEHIARKLGICEDTLRKYYDNELHLGKAEANDIIAKTLFDQAKEGNNAAMIFWMKAQAGWREKHDVNIEGGIKVEVVTGIVEGDGEDSQG